MPFSQFGPPAGNGAGNPDPLDDTVSITGLREVFEDDETIPPYLDLGLRCGGRTFRAAILRADDEWTVNVRDHRGKSLPFSGDVYPSIGDAVLAAMGLVLEVGQRRALWGKSQSGDQSTPP